MRLPVIEYLRWARLPKEGEFDLSRSGMEDFALEGLGVSAGGLLLPEGSDWGSPSLRAAIARSYSIPERNVLPSNGTTFALFLVYAALLEPGNRVLVEEPAYEPLRSIPLLFGARVDRLPRPFESGYRLDRDRLVDSLTEETRLVVLTDPHNPTGVRLTAGDREWLASIAEEHDVDVLLDEVYIDFDRRKEAGDGPRYECALRHGRRMISIGSLTKVYGLGRLRVGWILAREETIRRAAPLYDYTVGDLSGPSVALGVAALSKREAIREKGAIRSSVNGEIVAAWMKRRPDLEWVRPEAGITAFPRFRGGEESAPFVDFARKRHGVLVVPGGHFEDPRGFRLGYGIDPNLLHEALERLDRALSERPGR
ncbi:MAG: aminotransferase class I/II-fold pyridoxal phosphate-dependent enzyme [Candidatus Eisenbacteria bacterium]